MEIIIVLHVVETTPTLTTTSSGDDSHTNQHSDGWMNQAYSLLSTTHGHITDCKFDSVVYAGVCMCMRGDLMCTCLVWAERSMPDDFWVPSHRFNSATGEQKGPGLNGLNDWLSTAMHPIIGDHPRYVVMEKLERL